MVMAAITPDMSYSIRGAGSSDIALITALAKRIWPASYKGILTDEQIANMLLRIYSEENLRKEIDVLGHRFWIASVTDEDIAFASGYQENDIAWVKKIYVDKSAKGLGIGRALIDVIGATYPSAREVRLLVNPNNHPAMDFYRHVGFTEIGRKPVQMGDFHFDDHIFARPIQTKGL
jgi:diamine N-acetyltransferase